MPTRTCRSLHTPPPQSRGCSQDDGPQPLPHRSPLPRETGSGSPAPGLVRGGELEAGPHTAGRRPAGSVQLDARTQGQLCPLPSSEGASGARLAPRLIHLRSVRPAGALRSPCPQDCSPGVSPSPVGFTVSWPCPLTHKGSNPTLAGWTEAPGVQGHSPVGVHEGSRGQGHPPGQAAQTGAPRWRDRDPQRLGASAAWWQPGQPAHGGPRLSRLRGGLEEAGSASNTNRPRCPLQALRGGHHKPGAQAAWRLHTEAAHMAWAGPGPSGG